MCALMKLLILLHFIAISVSNCASKSIDKHLDSDPRIIYFIKDFTFLEYSDLSTLEQSKILWTNGTEMISMIALEYYSEGKTLFWTNKAGELHSVVLNEDVSLDKLTSSDENLQQQEINATLLYSEKNWYPKSMAVDEIGKKLYIVDTYERSIDVFDLDGKNKARLFTSKDIVPSEIVIDSNEGLLFLYAINFVKRRTELHRMNMDGSNHRIIIDNVEDLKKITLNIKDSFAIDRVNKQLYYRTSSNNISTVDYDGNGRRLVLNYNDLDHFEFYNNSLFWSRTVPHEHFLESIGDILLYIGFSGERFPLMSCDVTNRNLTNSSSLCNPIWKNELRMSYFNMFKIFDYIPTKKLANPCLETENGCEDHCLLKPSGIDRKLSYGCACRLGRKLNSDEKTCSDISQEIVDELSTNEYETVWYLYNSTLENSTKDESGDVSFYKIPITSLFVNMIYGGPDSVWDESHTTVYKVTYEGLVKYATGGHKQKFRNPSESIAKVLSCDWLSKNLYYAKLINDSDQEYSLFVIPTRHPEKEMFLGKIDKPTSMAVHPYRGYVFVATYNEAKNVSHIVRFNTDGKNRLELPYSNNTKIVLTVDMDEDKLYWTDECSEETSGCLRSANLDGSDGQLLKNSRFNKSSNMMIIHREKIYIRTDTYEFYMLDKTGKEYSHWNFMDLGPISDIIATKGKDKKINTQYLRSTNPCVQDNGGCETFCFAVPTNDSKNLQKVCSDY